jgi:integrase
MAKKKRDGFYKRGKYWWCSNDPVTHKPESTKCTSIEARNAWFRERELMAHDPNYAASKSATLGHWIEKTKALRAPKSSATKRHDDSKYKAILGVLPPDTKLWSITAGTFDEYVIARRGQFNAQKKRAPGDYTIRRELNKLLHVLTVAKRRGCYAGDLDALMPENLEGHYTPRERALTDREFTEFMRCLPTGRWRAFAGVCVAVGCRKAEACKLTRKDVNFELGLIYLPGTKTERSNRELPIVSLFRPLLEQVVEHLPIGPISNVDRTFKLACKRAGIDRCSPNDLRRTHSTWLGERGLHDDTIARLLGHTTVTLTKRTYNRARALELAPLAEAQLLNAAPIEFTDKSLRLDDKESKKWRNPRKNTK